MTTKTHSLEWKRLFIRELIETIQDEIIANTDKMPDHWDGIELRRYITKKFKECEAGDFSGSRKRDFENEILVLNL